MITHEPVKGFYSIVTLDEKKIVTKRISDVYQNLYQHPPSSPHQSTPPSSLHQFTSSSSSHQSTSPSLITSTHLPLSSLVHITSSPYQSTSPSSPHQSTTPPAYERNSGTHLKLYPNVRMWTQTRMMKEVN